MTTSELTPLLLPRAGVPPVITTESAFEEMISTLLNGVGPIAIDAERASGYKYSQRAYLIQLYRVNGGLHLIDPIAIENKSLWQEFNKNFANIEWVIHASTQDLPCLLELGLNPQSLFDTELGARIAGSPRVGLGALAESLLELQLAKEHSAVDWSIRPLKPEWLTYAALDVDVLLDIRQKVEKLLLEKNKLDWAKEDFAAILLNFKSKQGDQPKVDRWRKTSGMHKVRDRLTMTIIKDLWLDRDQLAQELDIAPGRILNDEAIIEIATKKPSTIEAITKVIGWRSKMQSPPYDRWLAQLNHSLATPVEQQVELRIQSNNLPPIKVWKERNPLGYARLSHARAGIAALALELDLPIENLITPELVRKLCWELPRNKESDYEIYVAEQLKQMGARDWQISQVTPVIAQALPQTEAVVVVADSTDSNEAEAPQNQSESEVER
jgi:ribonuclease D